MTTAYTDFDTVATPVGVYPPQQDSYLLVEAMEQAGLAPGSRVADLCTGSGVVAVAAAAAGAAEVTAFDICSNAVQYARASASAAGMDVSVHRGSWARAVEFGPYDLVLANPPYVPHPPLDDTSVIPSTAGPAQAWNAGTDGRLVLDPLCAAAPLLLDEGGTMLIVHSECSNVQQTLRGLRVHGMRAEVVAQQVIPFGPVMTARAQWLMQSGLLAPGARCERIVVIRADAP
ncbi:methylase [Mycolicibacterium duvalii]|uniref:Methylase n=1 Tax=Mycolicibacterium duvalii TaxID=39688 RepID=A0A7I7K853_9MYCO|nr:class I SAM-dependent methyltransferase [Mycolicibacterium duvalii]MCV7366152.1 methyltransferase [Mycolicibacterium duvalii]PEG38809.1 methylase [Mycolicibacterium duvalii]BBX19602.1 methylase [Mycolicibacterium duvalii]